MVIPLKIKRRDFFELDSIPILVSHTVKTQKERKLVERFIFVYLQPSVNENS